MRNTYRLRYSFGYLGPSDHRLLRSNHKTVAMGGQESILACMNGDARMICPLTQAELVLVRKSWKILTQNSHQTGVMIFDKLFENHPKFKPLFVHLKYNKGWDMNDAALNSHIDIVMDALTATVESLDDPEELYMALNCIGKVHKTNCVNIHMIQKMWPCVDHVLQEQLQDDFTEPLQEAWQKVYQYMSMNMADGMKEKT